MKIAVGCITLVFSIVAAIQSYQIAADGVANQISQLIGDGGGGFIFSLLCLISGVLVFIKPIISAITLFLSTVLTVLIGLVYLDNVMIYWSIVPLALAVFCITMHRERRKLHVMQSASKS